MIEFGTMEKGGAMVDADSETDVVFRLKGVIEREG